MRLRKCAFRIFVRLKKYDDHSEVEKFQSKYSVRLQKRPFRENNRVKLFS